MAARGIREAVTAATGSLPRASHGAAIYLVVLLGILFSKQFIFGGDPNQCQALTTTGKWYNDWTWLPDGCRTMYHGSREINDCTNGEKRKIVFAGDLQTQGLYWAVVQRLQKDFKVPPPEKNNLEFSKDHIELEFIWDEFLNETKTVHRVEDLRDGKDIKPMMTVVGGGRWYAENGAAGDYAAAVQNLADIAFAGELPRVPLGSNSIFGAADGPGDLLLFAPVQMPKSKDPVGDDKSPYALANAELAQVARARPEISVLWSFKTLSSARPELFEDDGYLLHHDALKRQLDILFNLRCNANVGRKGVFPTLATCCAVWRGPNWIQLTFLLLAMVVLPAIVLVDLKLPILNDTSRPVVRGFCAFAAAIALQWISDRTHVFSQGTRYWFEWPNLRNMIFVVLIIGFATFRRSKPPGKAPNTSNASHPFLPRDQTDEWKGWMQALIIVYHYNMAWLLDWFWVVIRLAVSSYLFLTGFGHTIFFLQKKDFSFKRFVNVMIRTNLLPCTLAYVMRTRWLLYYYMPLSTFWFTVVYATLAIGKRYNDYTLALLAKISISAYLVHSFISIKDLPETFVKFFAITCRLSFNANDFFHHRVQQDQYIVYVGMLAAIFYIWAKDVLTSDRRRDRLSTAFRAAFPALKWSAILASAAAMVYFWYLVRTRMEKQSQFTAVQPYISLVPILAFAVLRNAHPVLRNWHSAAFAWLGRYSGEMYVMQDHIWLASDQEAILRTGLFSGDDSLMGDRWRDLVLLTPLYLIACSVIGDATGVIANWFVKEEKETGAGAGAANPSASSVSRGRTPASEVEMGLLAGQEGDRQARREDDEEDEKMAAQEYSRRSRIGAWTKVGKSLWPRSVRNRAFLVLFAMWVLNMTYT